MPIITVSRMFGSNGSEVAEQIARGLGWPLLDNAFVDAVAERLGVTSDDVRLREERVPSLVQRLADTLALGAPEVLTTAPANCLPPSEEQIVAVSTRIIDEAVARGPAVLVGRGAQSVLAERADVIHVFCYAPRTDLVTNTAERLGLSMNAAAARVDDMNRQREQYVRRHWGRSWRAHENYDLGLNTSGLGIAGAAEIVVRLARERFALR